MPRFNLKDGEYVSIEDGDDGPILRVGNDEEGYSSAVEIPFDQLDDVVFLIANNEHPEEPSDA